MKKQLKTLIISIAAAAATMALASQAQAQTNLLSDGDFEAFAGQIASGGWMQVNGGGTVGAWTVGGNSVDLVRDGSGSISGVSVDLSGAAAGSLSQNFTAQAGYTYTLSWDYFKNQNGTDMTVSFGGADHVYAPAAAVTTASLSFTALTSGSQTVSFAGGNSGFGPTLDNVSLTVTAVPEPQSYALLMAGLGAVGLVFRRRGLSSQR